MAFFRTSPSRAIAFSALRIGTTIHQSDCGRAISETLPADPTQFCLPYTEPKARLTRPFHQRKIRRSDWPDHLALSHHRKTRRWRHGRGLQGRGYGTWPVRGLKVSP